MIKGKTNSGIKFEIDERILKDMRFARLYANVKTQKTANAAFKLIDFIFGGEANSEAFMDAVAQKNDGLCDEATLSKELNEILNALSAKK